MADHDEPIARANAEANQVFGRLAKAAEEAAKHGGAIKVLDVARQVGLEIDERTLTELQIEPVVYCLPWLPWYYWYPWRPLWCWWWNRNYYWYRCCPWWWYRCHFYAI
ncbi:MAG TPA: hypothetical protein VIA62_12790 [Thermoanaerobaculia bacterium]|jgi:hypothetical protein|nr:hypothetical protein [Thermoanaerobaculia bacterium]